MKLRKVMASVCCMGLVAGLAGCGGSTVVTRTDGFIVKNGFLSRILYPPVK